VSIRTALLECFFGREHDDFPDCSILHGFQNQFQLATARDGRGCGPCGRERRTRHSIANVVIVLGWPPVDVIHKADRAGLTADRLPDKMKAPRSHPSADSRRASLSGKEYRYFPSPQKPKLNARAAIQFRPKVRDRRGALAVPFLGWLRSRRPGAFKRGASTD
jgi:hypothetical protein